MTNKKKGFTKMMEKNANIAKYFHHEPSTSTQTLQKKSDFSPHHQQLNMDVQKKTPNK